MRDNSVEVCLSRLTVLAVPVLLVLGSVITLAAALPVTLQAQGRVPPEVVRVDALLSRKAIKHQTAQADLRRDLEDLWPDR